MILELSRDQFFEKFGEVEVKYKGYCGLHYHFKGRDKNDTTIRLTVKDNVI